MKYKSLRRGNSVIAIPRQEKAIQLPDGLLLNSFKFFSTPADGYFAKFKILVDRPPYKFNLTNNFVRLNGAKEIYWHSSTEVDQHTYQTILAALKKASWIDCIGRSRTVSAKEVVDEEELVKSLMESVDN